MDTPETATVEVTQALEPCPWCETIEHLSYQWPGSMTADMPDRPCRVICTHIDHDTVVGPTAYGKWAAAKAWNRPHRTRATRQDGLREALVQHNERLRSAVAIADRDGADTNWLAFRGQCRFTLAEYHDVVNEARAALSRHAGYAPGNYSIMCIDCRKECHDCDKRAIRCADCAAALSDSSTREESGAALDQLQHLGQAYDAGDALPADVRRLVIAAREIAFNDWDGDSEEWEVARKELDDASEAFASRVPWDDEPAALSASPEGEGK